MDTNRNDGGRFTPEHTDDEVLAAVRAHEPAATSEVAEELGITRQGADYRLRQLHDQGRVSNKKIGASLVWFAPSETSPTVEPDTNTNTPDTSEGSTVQPSQTTDELSSARDEARQPIEPAVADSLDDIEFPGGRNRDDCIIAVHAARDYLRNHGPASMREIVANVMPNHPVGYDIPELQEGERYRGAWWRRVVKPGLKTLSDVEAPSRGASDWRYIGDSGQ